MYCRKNGFYSDNTLLFYLKYYSITKKYIKFELIITDQVAVNRTKFKYST